MIEIDHHRRQVTGEPVQFAEDAALRKILNSIQNDVARALRNGRPRFGGRLLVIGEIGDGRVGRVGRISVATDTPQPKAEHQKNGQLTHQTNARHVD